MQEAILIFVFVFVFLYFRSLVAYLVPFVFILVFLFSSVCVFSKSYLSLVRDPPALLKVSRFLQKPFASSRAMFYFDRPVMNGSLK